MIFDILTIAFITGILYATQTVAVFVQYKVNVTYKGIGWWLAGTALQALGFILMLTLNMGPVWVLSVFANPLIILGQIFLYVGISRFLERRVMRRLLIALFAAFLICYYAFMVVANSIMWRTVVVSASTAVISLMIALRLFAQRKGPYSGSAIFAAAVFSVYGLFQSAMVVATLVLPPLEAYFKRDPLMIRVISFIVPMVVSTLWTFGFVIMVNQRLNAEILEKNENLQILLREVHHRIKNNMSTMMSMLSLQAGNMKDPVSALALEDAGNRMQSMGLLYDKLFHSADFSELPMDLYLSSLVDEILSNYPGRVSIKVLKHIEGFVLDAKRLQPIGIIINELITNVLKYAFVDRDKGTITISATLADGRVSITVQDDGVGIPEPVDFEDSTGFGLTLVKALTAQLAGTIAIERENGTRIKLEFVL